MREIDETYAAEMMTVCRDANLPPFHSLRLLEHDEDDFNSKHVRNQACPLHFENHSDFDHVGVGRVLMYEDFRRLLML